MSPPQTEPEWYDAARRYGCFDEHDTLLLDGRIVVDEVDTLARQIKARLITPLRADPYSANLTRKEPPFRFDRASDGSAILPGRWFLTALESVRDDPARSAAERELAATSRNFGVIEDAHIPTSSVVQTTVTWAATGEAVECELVLPPLKLVVNVKASAP